MRPRHRNRAPLGGALLAMAIALGAVALLALPGVAAARDRNHDHISDRWEKRHHLSLHVNQAKRDQDRDHLDNRGEFQAGDNPRDRDTDNDGVMDGEENAGTIASFDSETGKLTIDLFGGETVTGFVTEDTRIVCGHERNHNESGDDSGASASDDGHSGPGDDNSGPGDDNSGPGNGDDEGDDPIGGSGMPGDDQGPGNDDDQGDNGASCTTAALVVGATVEEAELRVSNGRATFEKVVLQQEGQSEQDDQPHS